MEPESQEIHKLSRTQRGEVKSSYFNRKPIFQEQQQCRTAEHCIYLASRVFAFAWGDEPYCFLPVGLRGIYATNLHIAAESLSPSTYILKLGLNYDLNGTQDASVNVKTE